MHVISSLPPLCLSHLLSWYTHNVCLSSNSAIEDLICRCLLCIHQVTFWMLSLIDTKGYIHMYHYHTCHEFFDISAYLLTSKNSVDLVRAGLVGVDLVRVDHVGVDHSGVARTSPLLGHSMGTLHLYELPREVQKLIGGPGGILPPPRILLPGRFWAKCKSLTAKLAYDERIRLDRNSVLYTLYSGAVPFDFKTI